MDKQTDRETNRQTNRQTGRQTDRQADRQTDRQTDKQTDRQTNRQTSRQTDRQPDRQAGRQTDRPRHRFHISFSDVKIIQMKISCLVDSSKFVGARVSKSQIHNCPNKVLQQCSVLGISLNDTYNMTRNPALQDIG